MDDYTTNDLIDCICLKNQLVNAPLSKMMEEYQDYDSYAEFLLAVLVLRDTDSGFLLFDDSYCEKILQVLQIHRFDEIHDDVRNTINEIIEYVNYMKNMPTNMKTRFQQEYRSYQEEIRKIGFVDDACLLYSLGYDAIVLMALKEHNLDFITEDDLFLASINYFMETMPELFEDEVALQMSSDKIDQLTKNGGIFSNKIRTYSRQTKRYFQKKIMEE